MSNHPHAHLRSVTCIWRQADHNAFTDLHVFHDKLFCCFRESNQHDEGDDGKIRILTSEDGLHWRSLVLLAKEDLDLRDPKLSTTPDGRLMLICGGSSYRNGLYVACQPQVAFSYNGADWSDIQAIDLPNEWIWQIAWNRGIGYGFSYRYSEPGDFESPWILTLFKTEDGRTYDTVKIEEVSNHPSEATIRFLPDDTMIALLRRQGKGWIGQSAPPYTEWHWHEILCRLGGPNFITLPDQSLWASSRLIVGKGETAKTFTATGPMTQKFYHPSLLLPSGGDTGYPGMVLFNNTLLISYYSSHEGKSNIYLASIYIRSKNSVRDTIVRSETEQQIDP